MGEYTNVKSVIIDIANNYGNASGYTAALRAVEFFSGGSLIPITAGDITCYGAGTPTTAANAFITSLSKTGASSGNEWVCEGDHTSFRIICVFDTVKSFNELRVNNAHDSGSDTDRGVQDTKIYVSTDSITNTTYGAAISNSTLIYDDTVAEHIASDVSDDQILLAAGNEFELNLPSPTLNLFLPDNLFMEIPSATFESSGESSFAGELSMTIPPILFSASTSASDTFDDFDMELPSLRLAMEKAGGIGFEFPMLELESSGKTGKLADFKATLPGLTMSAKSGSSVEMELPFLSLESEVSHSTYLVEVTGDLEGSIPSLQARIISVPDDTIEMDIPMLTMAMVTQQSGDNDIGFSLPALMAIMEAGTITDDALRYVRGKVR